MPITWYVKFLIDAATKTASLLVNRHEFINLQLVDPEAQHGFLGFVPQYWHVGCFAGGSGWG